MWIEKKLWSMTSFSKFETNQLRFIILETSKCQFFLFDPLCLISKVTNAELTKRPKSRTQSNLRPSRFGFAAGKNSVLLDEEYFWPPPPRSSICDCFPRPWITVLATEKPMYSHFCAHFISISPMSSKTTLCVEIWVIYQLTFRNYDTHTTWISIKLWLLPKGVLNCSKEELWHYIEIVKDNLNWKLVVKCFFR